MSYIKDLEVGKVYRAIIRRNLFLELCNGKDYCPELYVKEKSFKSEAPSGDSYPWELASTEESNWLKACIKAGKFIPEKQNTKPNYFIY